MLRNDLFFFLINLALLPERNNPNPRQFPIEYHHNHNLLYVTDDLWNSLYDLVIELLEDLLLMEVRDHWN